MEGPKGVPNWGGGARGMQKLEAGNRNGQPHIAENTYSVDEGVE